MIMTINSDNSLPKVAAFVSTFDNPRADQTKVVSNGNAAGTTVNNAAGMMAAALGGKVASGMTGNPAQDAAGDGPQAPAAAQPLQNSPKKPTTIDKINDLYTKLKQDYDNGNLTPDKFRDYAKQFKSFVGQEGLSTLDEMWLKRASTHLDALALNKEATTAYKNGDKATGMAKLLAANAALKDLLNQYFQAYKIVQASRKQNGKIA